MNKKLNYIREKNKEYYHCETYSLLIKRRNFWFSVFYLITLLGVSLYIKQRILEINYLEQSSSDIINGEVIDWVEKKLLESMFDSYSIFLIVFVITIAIYLIYVNFFKNGYDIYKKKNWYILLPSIITFIVIIIFSFNLINSYENEVNTKLFIYIISLFLNFLPIISGLRGLLPLEFKKPLEKTAIIFDFLSDKMLKKL